MQMKKYGLIGQPITHSKSPALFHAAYGGRFSYNLIEAADFRTSYRTFLDSYDGINVTAPYKGEACAAADELDHTCIITGAANCLVKKENGSVKACNTDVDGVRASLREHYGLSLRSSRNTPKCGTGKTALVVGCGGAGKAAAFAAVLEEFQLILLNRTALKAEVYARKLMTMGKTPVGTAEGAGLEAFGKMVEKADVLIWTLPVPIPALDGLTEQVPERLELVLEANYRDPVFSTDPLARKMKEAGITVIPGEKWLLHQGAAAYRIFTGEKPDIEAMAEVL